MSDNELIAKLQSDIISAVNASQMPLMVKSIVLENVLLRVNASIRNEAAESNVEPVSNSTEKEG